MKTKYEISLQRNTIFFFRSSGPPTFYILPKLHELCKSCCRKLLETLGKKGFEHYGQQLLRFLRVHQCNPNQMKISKDQSTQTTARAVGMAFYLWLPFLNQRSAQLNKVNKRCIRSIFGQHLFCLLRPH